MRQRENKICRAALAKWTQQATFQHAVQSMALERVLLRHVAAAKSAYMGHVPNLDVPCCLPPALLHCRALCGTALHT